MILFTKSYIMRYLICFTILLPALLLQAQSEPEDRKIHFGLTSALQLASTGHYTNTSKAAPWGMGLQYELWLALRPSAVQYWRISLGCHQHSDYRQRVTRFDEVVLPTEVQLQSTGKQLLGLRYVDLTLSWNKKWREQNPWWLEVGVSARRLQEVLGSKQVGYLVSGLDIQTTETSSSLNTRAYSFSEERQPLAMDEFERFDFGLQFGVQYELVRGLWLRLAYYQGFQTIGEMTAEHRISSLSLGARIRIL